jgi:PAS domain S-box-containing protein
MSWQRPDDSDALILAAGDAIIAAAADGSVLLWNPAAERIFGYTEGEALGRTLDLIVPERFRSRHWNGFHRVMRTGSTRYGTRVLRVPAEHKDGHRVSIAFTVSLLFTSSREVKSIAAIVRDESERWQEERVLRDRLSELESRLHERGGM